jgi:hypothetical protein
MARRWGIAGALALALGVLASGPAQPQIGGVGGAGCGQTFQGTVGALAQIVAAGATGQRVLVCGYEVTAGAATGTFQLEYGTGTNCGTGTTALTPAYTLGINGVLVSRSPVAQMQTPANNALCWVSTGTGPVVATVYFGLY